MCVCQLRRKVDRGEGKSWRAVSFRSSFFLPARLLSASSTSLRLLRLLQASSSNSLAFPPPTTQQPHPLLRRRPSTTTTGGLRCSSPLSHSVPTGRQSRACVSLAGIVFSFIPGLVVGLTQPPCLSLGVEREKGSLRRLKRRKGSLPPAGSVSSLVVLSKHERPADVSLQGTRG